MGSHEEWLRRIEREEQREREEEREAEREEEMHRRRKERDLEENGFQRGPCEAL